MEKFKIPAKYLTILKTPFDINLFKPILNAGKKGLVIKPLGGLWASPIIENSDEGYDSDWIQWCMENGQKDWIDYHYAYELTMKPDARIYVIDELNDAKELQDKYTFTDLPFPFFTNFLLVDWELVSKDYDAVLLTSRGQRETRLSHQYSMYGWNVISLLILNKDSFTIEGAKGKIKIINDVVDYYDELV